jgi:hypothetical protein
MIGCKVYLYTPSILRGQALVHAEPHDFPARAEVNQLQVGKVQGDTDSKHAVNLGT